MGSLLRLILSSQTLGVFIHRYTHRSSPSFSFFLVRSVHASLGGDDYVASIDDYLARNCPEPLAVYTFFLDDGAHQLKKLLFLVDTVVDANDGVSYTIELIVDYPDVSGNGSNKVYDEEHMSGFLEKKLKIESRFRESALMLENRLAEKCIARMQAEAKTLEAETKLLHEMSGLRLYLEKACSFFGWPDLCLFRQAGLRPFFVFPGQIFQFLWLARCLLVQAIQIEAFFVFAAQIADFFVSLAGLLVQAIRIEALVSLLLRFCRCELKKMEIEQELEWKAAQSTKISVDLVIAAKQQLKFLAAIDRGRWLYEGRGLDRAIYRVIYPCVIDNLLVRRTSTAARFSFSPLEIRDCKFCFAFAAQILQDFVGGIARGPVMAVYVAVMQNVSTSNRFGYDSLLKIYRETYLSQEKTRILGFISFVRSQDAVFRLDVSREARETAWDWLKDNWDNISKTYGAGFLITRFISTVVSLSLVRKRQRKLNGSLPAV
ncbi:hypothetical protein OROMI_022007 [Orobanche minor]